MSVALFRTAAAEETPGVTLARGYVSSAADGIFALSGPEGPAGALRAVSCLIRPEAGDEVLYCQDREQAFILSVLRRAQPAGEAAVILPQKTSLKNQELRIDGARLKVRSEDIEILPDQLSVKGKLMSLDFSVLTLITRLATAIFGSLLSRSKTLNLENEKTVRLATGRLSLKAEEDITARAANVDFQARDSVKIDGRAIRLG
jgi:hypothetical protein